MITKLTVIKDSFFYLYWDKEVEGQSKRRKVREIKRTEGSRRIVLEKRGGGGKKAREIKKRTGIEESYLCIGEGKRGTVKEIKFQRGRAPFQLPPRVRSRPESLAVFRDRN